MSKKNKNETQETRAVRLLANALQEMLNKATDGGMPICNDKKAAKALRKLKVELEYWL